MKRRILWWGVGILLLSLLVRAGWLTLFPADPLEPVDAKGYHLLACNLLAGQGFSLQQSAPFCLDTIRTPLYPLFLAAIYRLWGFEPAGAVLVQPLLETLTTALVLRLGRELGGARVGWVAALCYALNGSTQRYTSSLYAETLLLPLVVGALWVSLLAFKRATPGRVMLAALCWGLAVLTKPNVQFLTLSVGLWGALYPLCVPRPERFTFYASRAGLYFVTLLAVLAPWLFRNHCLLDRWLLSTAFEENLARVSAIATLAEVAGVYAEPWTPTWEHYYLSAIVDVAMVRFEWGARAETGDECRVSRLRHREMYIVAREIVWEHPCAALVAHARGVGRSLLDMGHRKWYPLLTGRAWESTGVLSDIWQRMGESLRLGAVGDAFHAFWLERVVRIPPLAGVLWWGLLAGRIALWGLCGRGTLWLWRAQPEAALLLLGTIAYFMVLPGPIAYERFYLPAIPAVVVLAALALRHPA
ncbi:MAG TPA: glycosyltransferase family 39 protein [Thermoflexia bacterium]|nr:glycosyltransferase family 39 protein [Thermoflexia bacterium]